MVCMRSERERKYLLLIALKCGWQVDRMVQFEMSHLTIVRSLGRRSIFCLSRFQTFMTDLTRSLEEQPLIKQGRFLRPGREMKSLLRIVILDKVFENSV